MYVFVWGGDYGDDRGCHDRNIDVVDGDNDDLLEMEHNSIYCYS